MSKSRILAFLAALLVIAGGVFALSQGSDNKDKPPASVDTKGNQNPPQTTEAMAEGNIDIKNMMFTPPQITVKEGGKVIWTNNDSVAHTVTADLGNGPDSDTIEPGGTYTFVFDETGSYQYHCDIHPSMRGTIVVK